MDMSSLNKFHTYKSDWKIPIHIGKQGSAYRGKAVTFQRTMKVTLVVGQCFGLNPVLGVCESDASKLRFKFRSWRFVYTVVTILSQSSLVLLCSMKMFRDTDSSLGSNTSIIFHTISCLTGINFLRIAMKWPKLCMYIARTEASDPNMDIGLPTRCHIRGFFILMMAIMEHILSDIQGISIALDCRPDTNLYEAFITGSFSWIIFYIPYSPIVGIVTQFLNIQCTFNWNYVDVFVICMSMYLTSRLEQVTQRINAVKGKYVPQSFWRTMREDYNRLANLVRMVDDIIGGIVFLSFANNLFFICLQLLHALAEGIKSNPRCRFDDGPDKRPFHGYEQAIYFIYSFVFLLIRSLSVSMAAARVHTASKAPAHALYDVSSAAYCIEIERFLNQIHGDTVALSGLQFFNVKRGLILTIAGTIVTYELVLMQFTGVTPTSPSPT